MPKPSIDTNFLFHSFENQRIMVVGDVMLDRYISGRANRISPEAPVPILEIEREENRLGGAGNVALNLQALGAKTLLCGVVGNDADGQVFFEKMENENLETSGILSSAERMTTVKSRVIAGSQQLLRMDRENTHQLSESETYKFLATALNLLAKESITGLVFQDYNKGVLTLKVIQTLIEACKKRNILVSVDPKYRNFWAYQSVDLFKPNLKEVCDALQIQVKPNLESLRTATNSIQEKLKSRNILITLSEFGVFFDDGQTANIYPTKPRNVADVCGAGDTVISIAALALGAGLSGEEIALLANLAGGQVVEKNGVVTVSKAQLRQELMQF